MNGPVHQPPAVVLGSAATGLYVVRELGRAKIPVIVVSRSLQCGRSSRYLTRHAVRPTSTEMLEWLLEEFAHGRPKPVLIPASDAEIEFVCANASVLSRHFRFQTSYTNGLAEAIVTKSSLYEICAEHDIAVPKGLVATRQELAAVPCQISYPFFVKPSRAHDLKHAVGGRKGWIVQSERDLARLIAKVPADNQDLIVQEIVPGPESNITLYCAYFDANGQPHQAFTGRKLRQYPPGFGSASLAVSEKLEETKEISECLLGAIGYTGIAASEFKRDPRDGRLKLIEINPRPSLWFELAGAAGRRVALAAYNDMADLGLTPEDGDQTDGTVWRYGYRDLFSASFYRMAPNFVLPPPDTSQLKSASKIVDAVKSEDDPGPAWAELQSIATGLAGRMRRFG